MKCLIRADSSTQIGAGHIFRNLALAAAIRARGGEAVFACVSLPGNSAKAILSEGYRLLELPGGKPLPERDDSEALLPIVREEQPDWVILDHYGLGIHWECRVRELGPKLLVIDDLPERKHDCDLYLNPNYLPSHTSAPEGATRALIGPRFALLSPGFRAKRPSSPRAGSAPKRILVSYGGADQENETAKVLAALRPFAGDIEFSVVLGAANPHHDSVRSMVEGLPKARLHIATSRMPELMADADLAFGAGGTSTWERSCMGLPSVVTALAENQEAGAAALAEDGRQIYLGPSRLTEPHHYVTVLEFLRNNRWAMAGLSKSSWEAVDGKGADRVARQLIPPDLQLRRATLKDSEGVLRWRNEPENRRHFHDPAPLPASTHETWFGKAITDPNRALLIAEKNGAPLGVIRFDFTGSNALVSIFLVPGDRAYNHGIGTDILRAGTQWLTKNRPEVKKVKAEVIEGNRRSEEAFLGAGYRKAQTVLEMELE